MTMFDDLAQIGNRGTTAFMDQAVDHLNIEFLMLGDFQRGVSGEVFGFL